MPLIVLGKEHGHLAFLTTVDNDGAPPPSLPPPPPRICSDRAVAGGAPSDADANALHRAVPRAVAEEFVRLALAFIMTGSNTKLYASAASERLPAAGLRRHAEAPR